MKKETLYIIGGSGFIGKNLVQCLLPYYEISIFDKYIDTNFFANYPSVKTNQLDLVTEEISPEINTPDYIINLASIVTAERDLHLFDKLVSSNLKILLNLYERFKEENSLKLFVQFGSSEEYGSVGVPFIEECREYPNSPYGLVKQLTVNTALMLCRNNGFPVTVVRPSNLFGPYQNASKFIPYVVTHLKKGERLSVSPCEQKRDFISAQDFVWCIGQLLSNDKQCIGEIINIGSGESISLKAIIEICKKELNSNSVIDYGALSYRENEAMDLICSVGKLSKILGCEIKFDFNRRLKEYIKQI